MGKKSLTKSTTKKKAKKNVKKPTVEAPTKSAEKKQAQTAKKKSASVDQSATTPLFRQFKGWTSKKLWKPKPDKAYEKNFSAPSFFDAKGKEAQKLRSLLFMTFDLDAAAKKKPAEKPSKKPAVKADAAKQAKAVAKPAAKPEGKKTEAKPKAAPKKKMSIKELISLSFDSWKPENPYIPAATGEYEKNFKAPPAFEEIDKAVLLKQFDLSVPDAPKPETPMETAIEPPVMEAPEMEAAEPVAAVPEPSPEIAAPAEEPAAETVEPETSAPEIETPKAEKAAAPPLVPETAAAPPETKAVETPEKKDVKEEKPPEIKAKPEAEAVAQETPSAPTREETAGYGSDNGNGGDGGDGGDDSGMPPQPPKEPLLSTGTKMLVAVLGIIFLILIASSIANSNRYFIKDTGEGIEIWRGEFSPKGKHKIVTLINTEAPEDQKRFYSRNEAMALAYDHFMQKAEALMEDTDMPIDMRGIRTSLENATKFANTSEQKDAVVTRLKQVDFAMLIYRADIAAEKQTIDGYENALDYLGQAAALDIDSIGRRDMVNAKIEHIQRRLRALEPEAPEDPVEDEETVDAVEPETEA